jgi:flagellar export protein FliJ
MPFRFPLAKVLLVKESVKKQEELALQKILLGMARVAHRIEQLSVEIAESHLAVERALQHPTPAAEVQTHFSRAQRATEEKQTLVRELQTLEQNRSGQAEKYHAAHRNCEVLIDLLDKQKDTYEQEKTRIEQKEMDDIVIARHPRR